MFDLWWSNKAASAGLITIQSIELVSPRWPEPISKAFQKYNRTFTFASSKSSARAMIIHPQKRPSVARGFAAPKKLFLHTFQCGWTLLLIAHVQSNHTLWLHNYRDLTCVYDGGTSHNPARPHRIPSWMWRTGFQPTPSPAHLLCT